MNGGSTVPIVEAKKTLARARYVTLTVEPLWVGTKSKSEPSHREALQVVSSGGIRNSTTLGLKPFSPGLEIILCTFFPPTVCL